MTIYAKPAKKWTASATHRLREKMGLSQQDFAEVLGTTRQTIINWECGHNAPNNMACRLLATLEERVDMGDWGSESDVSARDALDPHLTQMVLRSENPEATALTLLRIARMHRTTP